MSLQVRKLLQYNVCHSRESGDPLTIWIPAFAGMTRFVWIASSLALLAMTTFSCGSDTSLTFDVSIPTQSSPYINRIIPSNGAAGDTVTLFGFGFSVEASNNVVIFSSVSTTATAYGLATPATANEIEQLTVTVPSGATVGSNSVYVNVFENISNSNTSFTINP